MRFAKFEPREEQNRTVTTTALPTDDDLPRRMPVKLSVVLLVESSTDKPRGYFLISQEVTFGADKHLTFTTPHHTALT